MAGSNNSGMIKIALVGGAAYLAYRQGWLSFLGIGTPVVTTPVTTTPVTVVPDPNAIQGANTVAGIYARMVSAAKAPAEGLNVDEWGWNVNNVLAPLGKEAPDPLPLFQAAVPGFDRGQKLTAGQYWAVMGPALKSQLGLSGLGFFGGSGLGRFGGIGVIQ